MQIIHKMQKDYTLAEVTSNMPLLLDLFRFTIILISCIIIFTQIIGIIPKPPEISQKDLCYILILFLWTTYLAFNTLEEKNV